MMLADSAKVVVFPIVAPLGFMLIASISTPQAKVVPTGVEASCFLAGYASKGKSKNTSSVLVGGLLATALFVAVALAALSSY